MDRNNYLFICVISSLSIKSNKSWLLWEGKILMMLMDYLPFQSKILWWRRCIRTSVTDWSYHKLDFTDDCIFSIVLDSPQIKNLHQSSILQAKIIKLLLFTPQFQIETISGILWFKANVIVSSPTKLLDRNDYIFILVITFSSVISYKSWLLYTGNNTRALKDYLIFQSIIV
jgi:hypothetical protein